MSGFDDDFLAGPAPAPAPAKSAKGAASPSPVASSVDDFDAFVSAPSAVEQSSGFLSPEAAEPARATCSLERAGKSVLIHDGFGFLSPEVEAVNAAQAGVAGAQRLRAVVARVTPKQWGIALGGLALAVGLTFGVRWWMHRPATPAVAAAKTEVSAAPTSASTATVATPPVVTTTAPKKPAEPVTAATLLAAPAIAPTTSPSPTVERHAPRPVVAAPKKDPWQVAHAADIQKSMHADQKKSDAWAKDQAARLDAFFKKKH